MKAQQSAEMEGEGSPFYFHSFSAYLSSGSPSPAHDRRGVLSGPSTIAFDGRIGEPCGDPGRSAAFSDMMQIENR